MSQLNIELFKQVRNKIATTPEAYDQGVWGRSSKLAPCGTAGCIAGWACVLSETVTPEEVRSLGAEGELIRNGEPVHIHDLAQQVLGLDEEEAERLFTSEPQGDWEDYDDNGDSVYSDEGWPEQFAAQWRAAKRSERPAVAIAYLDHIIETGQVL